MRNSFLLRTEGISKEFSKVKVLQDIDFNLNPGEIHALIGENGAGKSTFVKIISGVSCIQWENFCRWCGKKLHKYQ